MNSWHGRNPANEIALIDPKGFAAGFQQRRHPGKKMVPHIGLGYVAASLEKNGEAVRVLDAGVATYREMQKFLSKPAYLFGITCAGHTFQESLQVARAVKVRYPASPVLLGGPQAAGDPQSCLQDPAVDYALQGEGEEAFIDFLEVLKRNSRPTAAVLSAIPGLVYRDEGLIRVNAAATRLKQLDDLPYPAWHLFPMQRYRGHVLLTSRGCSAACGFYAADAIWGRQLTRRQPEQVASEAAWLLTHWGRKLINLNDESLTADPEHAEALCRAFLKRRLHASWTARGSRTDALTPELPALMRRAGCHRILLEIASGDPEVLEAIGERADPKDPGRAIRLCREAGMVVSGAFLVGNPKDTEASVARSMAFAREQRIDLPVFNLAVPFPKTRLREYAGAQGRLFNPGDLAFGAGPCEPAFETPEFTVTARRRIFRAAREFSRRQYRYFHLKFWWTPDLIRRTGYEVWMEIKVWVRAMQWPFRRLLDLTLRRSKAKIKS